MSNKTIFVDTSIKREAPLGSNHWEDYLKVFTPVEQIENMTFKREDHFAPLGYGGINGSKVRQCIYLVNEYHNSVPKEWQVGLISGASVKSPQLAAGTIVAAHYGMESVHVIGATKPESALWHENVKIAYEYGAGFYINKVAYNPALQSAVKKIMQDEYYKNWFYLEYGIGLDHKTHTPQEVEAFHDVGANQVANLPSTMKTLIIPSGSCNTLVTILYGLAKYGATDLNKIILMYIGPDRKKFVKERLEMIKSVNGIDGMRLYDIVEEHDLHSTKYATYDQEMPFTYGDIEMHPTYEGKCMRYLKEKLPEYEVPETCLWVVGSKPYLKNMPKERNYAPSEEAWVTL